MRSWTKTLALTVLLGASGPVLDAQEVGDRVRVRLSEDENWTSGILVDFATVEACTSTVVECRHPSPEGYAREGARC